MRFPFTMFTFHTSFKPLLLGVGGGGWGRGIKSIIEVTVNSKVETLKIFVPNTSKNSASGLTGVIRPLRYDSPLSFVEAVLRKKRHSRSYLCNIIIDHLSSM